MIDQPATDGWFARSPEGEQFGPTTREQLDEWFKQGRIGPNWQIYVPHMEGWQEASTVYAGSGSAPPPPRPDAPRFCSACGESVTPQAVVCLKCGASVAKPGVVTINGLGTSTLSPVVALIISLLLPGLPQIIMGQVSKGIALLVGLFVIGIVTFGIGVVVIYVVSAVDAFKIAGKLEAGRTVDDWEFF